MHARRVATAFTLTLLCLQPRSARAQQFGVEGGLTRADLFSTAVWSSGTGFEIGAVAIFAASDRIGVQTGALFVRNASDARLADDVAEIRSVVTVDSIEVPLLVRFISSPDRRVSPVAFGGIFAAYNIRASARSSVGTSEVDEDIDDLVASADGGFVVGLGVEIRHRGLTWVADVRYRHSLARVMEEGVAPEGKARAIGIRGGFRW